MRYRSISGVAAVLILFSSSLFAARYERLGGYRDVEVIDITWRGIEIVHRDGSCRLTEEELSAEDRELLKEELEKLHTLQAEQQKLWKARQEQLPKEKKIADQQARQRDEPGPPEQESGQPDQHAAERQKKISESLQYGRAGQDDYHTAGGRCHRSNEPGEKGKESQQTVEHPPQRPEALPLRLQPGRAQAAHQQDPQR